MRDESAEPRTDWSGVAFGLSLGVLAAFQQFKLPPALPLLFGLYGYSRTLAGGFVSVYAVAGLLLSVPAGRAMVRRGPRGLLLASFALFLAGNAAALAVPEAGGAMLLSRLLEGLAAAVLAVVGAVVTTSSAAPRHKPLAVALWATWIPCGQVAGTLLAIPTVSEGQWRPLWWAALIATVAVAGWGARLAAKGSPALASPAGLPAVTSGKAGTAAQAGGDRRALVALAAVAFGLWSVQYIAYVTWLPQYLVEAHGFTPGSAARAYLVPSVLVIAFNLAAGVLLRRGVRLGRLLAGSVGLQALVWLLVPVTNTAVQGLASLATYGFAAGTTATCLFALPGAILGANASRGFGGIMAGRNLGVLAGPLVLAQVVAAAGGWGPVPAVFGGVSIVSAVVSAGLSRRLGIL